MARFTSIGGGDGSGVPGPQGPQGPAGETGPQGEPGIAGADALWNFVGEYNNGADYYPGDVVTYAGGTYYRVGEPNPGYPPGTVYWTTIAEPGADGLPGADGADGDSAYQVALNNGFIGTEAEWLDSLIGPQGPQGEPGISGAAAVLSHYVKAGEVLTKGQAVYVSSADGTNMIVSKASNATEATSSKTIGLISTDLQHNEHGYVITEGLLEGLNTASAANGDPVWLGTDGNLIYGLTNKPYAPAHLVFIGVVTRSNANNGEIFIKPQNGFELHELHTVSLESNGSIADNEVLAYDTASGLWKNQTPSEAGFATVATSGSYNDLINKPTLVTNLNSLSDVTITGTPTNQQLIVYDTVTGQWENKDAIASTGIAYKSGFPASKTSTGITGQIAIDGANGTLYVCTSTNTWQKVSLNGANFTNAGGFI